MELSGPEKAVLMLLSLDEATATPILSEMDAADVRKLREAASNMRAVPATALEHVYAEFIQQTKDAVAVPRGGVRYLRRLAGRARGAARWVKSSLPSSSWTRRRARSIAWRRPAPPRSPR